MSADISVVIPTFNDAQRVGRAVQSVLAQTLHPREILVVDDGSTDETTAALRVFDGQVRVIRQENKGAGAARNTGVRAARGEWLAFLDSDDEWLSSKLQAQWDLLRQRSPDVVLVYSSMINVASNGERGLIWPTPLAKFAGDPAVLPHWAALECFPPTSTALALRSKLLEAGLFADHIRTAEDLDLWVRLATLGHFVAVTEPLALRHVRASSLTNTTHAVTQYRRYLAVLRSRRVEIRKWAGEFAGPGASYVHAMMANSLNKEGRVRAAIPHAIRGAIRRHPQRGLAAKLLIEGLLGTRLYAHLTKLGR